MRVIMAFLLGGWLLGMVLIAFVAAENFFVVDRLLESPPGTEYRAEFQKRLAASQSLPAYWHICRCS